MLKRFISLVMVLGILLSLGIYSGGVYAEEGYIISKTAADYTSTSATVEEGTTPESFTLATGGYVTWEVTPTDNGVYELGLDYTGSVTVSFAGKKTSVTGSNIAELPINVLPENANSVQLFKGITYTVTVTATSDETVVSGMSLTWKEALAEGIEYGMKVTYNCGTGDATYTDLETGDINKTKDEPIYYLKEVAVPYDANYTFSLNLGTDTEGKINIFIERIKSGNITILSTDGISNIKNQVLFEDVPLEAGESYRVTVFNAKESILRIQDIVLERTGKYVLDINSVTFLANDYTTRDGGMATSMDNKQRMALTSNKGMSYDLKLGAGNYKVYAYCGKYTGTPLLRLYLDSKLISLSEYEWQSSKVIEYDIGTISVTDDMFTLRVSLPKTETITRLWFYRFKVERIDTPEVTVHSTNEPSYSNKVSTLSEGTLTAKAYLPEAVANKPVTVLFAIYDAEGSLYKVEKTTVENAAKNQVVNVTLSDISFEEGKTYTSKVFFLNDMTNIQALYKTDGVLTGAKAVVTE